MAWRIVFSFVIVIVALSVSGKNINKPKAVWTKRRGVCRGGLVKLKGFRALALYIADGEFDAATSNPRVPNCFMGVCEATFFWRNVARVSDEVRAMETNRAKEFFFEKWGIPVDKFVEEGKILFQDAYLDPRVNYRCRALEGKRIHRLGWEVHDQFFLLSILQELTVSGPLGRGRTLSPGNDILFGQYKIERSRIKKGVVVGLKKFVDIRYESIDPVPPAVNARRMSTCSISQSPWGTGIAILSISTAAPSGKSKASWRTVLTMDGGDGLGTFDGVYN